MMSRVVMLGALIVAASAATAHAASAAPSPSAAPSTSAASSASWWHPTASGPNDGPEFQWELDHPLNLKSRSDMGIGDLNELHKTSPTPTVYDIDGIINPASTIAALHKLGDKTICYIEVGAAGNYYSAAQEHLKTTYYAQLKAAHDLGDGVSGYPERYLNIKAASTLRIIEAMIRQQCSAKGFDAVEPDIDDSFSDTTGFGITEAQNISYDKTLGAYAHSLGLAWGQKNGDANSEFSAALEPTTDFLLDEECNFYHTCNVVTPPYVHAGKLVLNAEYTADWGSDVFTDLAKFCTADLNGHIDGVLFNVALTGPRNPCR
jgi:hypothetical protein